MRNRMTVTDSQTISLIEYDTETKNMIVEFKAGSKYRYRDVDTDTLDAFLNAESKGKYFAAHIKNKFITEKIGVVLNKPRAFSHSATTEVPNFGAPSTTASVDDSRNFEAYLEWTPEEEEAFLNMVDNSINIDSKE